jgi:hypothetical protein
LWNFHSLVTPLAAVALGRAPAALAWATIALFAIGNLRVGAQLTFVPQARFALGASCLLALVAAAMTMRDRMAMSGHPGFVEQPEGR